MKILVTGGCGFIGSNFVRYILNNTDWEVINIDLLTYAGVTLHPKSSRYLFYQADIGTPDIADIILSNHKPDYVVNFAAETHVDRSIEYPDQFLRTNVIQTYQFICSLLKYHKVNPDFRFVHISTDEVFGDLQRGEPAFTEESQYAPNSPYSATKASSDHLVRAFHKTYGLPAIITNCSNNYGPYQFPEKFIPVVILKAHLNKNIPIYGTGMNIRDWLYVEDHCDAIFNVLLNGKNGSSYNIGGNAERNNLEVAHQILDIMGKSESLISFVEDRKGHDFRYAMDISRINKELGWSPRMNFTNGLHKTVEWYMNNLEWVTSCVNLESF
jgi:dTDP-glucose 4,6-dehydratase